MNNEKHFFELTGLSAIVWEQMDGKKSVDQIVGILKRRSQLSAASLKLKTTRLLRELKKFRLLSG